MLIGCLRIIRPRQFRNKSTQSIQKIFTEGAFSINRTEKSFASVPVDIALEQTINAKAKSWLKGIMAFANISTAVNRWIVAAKFMTASLMMC